MLPFTQLVTFSPRGVAAIRQVTLGEPLRAMITVGYVVRSIGSGTAFPSMVLSLISGQQGHFEAPAGEEAV